MCASARAARSSDMSDEDEEGGGGARPRLTNKQLRQLMGPGGDDDDAKDPDAGASDSEEEAVAPKPKAKPAAKKAATGAKGKGKATASGPVALRSESKLKQLLKLLKEMREDDETSKALIFSQARVRRCVVRRCFRSRT